MATLSSKATPAGVATVASQGALATQNTVNVANQVAGSLALASFAGYNSGTGITVNNSTGAVTSNVTAGDSRLPFYTATAGTASNVSNGNATNVTLAGSTNGRYFTYDVDGNTANWPDRTITVNGANSWFMVINTYAGSTTGVAPGVKPPLAQGAGASLAILESGTSFASGTIIGFVAATSNLTISGQTNSNGLYWDV